MLTKALVTEIVMLIEKWLMGEECSLNTLPVPAQEYILASKHAPSRMVGAHAFKNLCSFIPSKKMGMTISTESFSAERAFAMLCEYDDAVYGYYDQPQPIMIKKTDKNGKFRSVSYTPDFLVETKKGVYIIEVKPLSKIQKLIEKEPSNWKKSSDDYYSYEPAKEAFEELGLKFRVWVYQPEFRYKFANISILLASRVSDGTNSKLISKIDALFDEAFYWSLHDLSTALGESCLTNLIQLIDTNFLYADLDSSLLSEPRGCVVVKSKDLLATAIHNQSRSKPSAIFSNSLPRSVIPSNLDAIKILERINRIKSGEVSRSVRRWNKKIKDSEGLSVFESLIDKSFQRGNRAPRLNSKVFDYLDYHLKEVHGKQQGLSYYRSYIKYCVESKKHHPEYGYVSFKTFLRYIKKLPESYIAFQRGGRRSRNGVLEPTNPLERNLKFQIPWQAAAIDEYLADIYLVFYTADGTPYVDRPWLAAMIDLSTSKILAITISFKSPSKRSLAKVLRECVRNHGKLPQEILFDRGSNYKSKYAAELLAHLGIINTMRPAAYSRSGGEIEALFGEFIKQWLSQRPGNLADYKEARSVDGKMAPKNKAVITPYDFYREIKLFSNWRDAKPAGFGDSARVDRFNMGNSQFPFMGLEIQFDEKFKMITAVDTSSYTVDPQRGIHIGELFYWSPELSNIRGQNKKVEVRIDPENPHIIFALINNQWAACYSSKINNFNVKDFESQFIEGLIALETSPKKSKLKHEANKNLLNIISSLDQKPQNEGQFKIIDVELESKSIASDENPEIAGLSIFDKVRSMAVKTIKSGSW
jgi:transposase InsO family protein